MRVNWKKNRPKPSIEELAGEVRRQYNLSSSLDDEKINKLCIDVVSKNQKISYLNSKEKEKLARLVFCSLRCELEILQDIADDPDISEIMINGKDHIFYEKHGEIIRADMAFETTEQLESIIQRLAAKVGREMNDLNPIVDARLSDGSRVNAVHSNIAIGGPILTIRKFNQSRMTIDDLIMRNDITKEAADFLKKLVEARYNIFVSGGTSSGKTTFLNVLSDYIPSNERVIVIEDSAELQIRNHENLVRMESKSANAQGKGEVTIKDLIKSSLRMRPDRIIVGEVRGDEVVDMLAAMSTGHDGSLSTGHANSPAGMIGRLETLHIAASGFPMQAVRSQIAGAIEIFVHLTRFPGGHRKVTEISEIDSYENGEIKLNKIFSYENTRGLVRAGQLIHKDKLERLQSI
ncbi:MAG: CpaF family protein [Bacillota bacterium]|nr:CpaF family protein [Bacillota bacterium]